MSVNDIKINLCNRAHRQHKISKGSIAGVVLVLIFGLYIFIFQSPKIAALDIMQKRKSETKTDTIKQLASINIDIDLLRVKIKKIKMTYH